MCQNQNIHYPTMHHDASVCACMCIYIYVCAGVLANQHCSTIARKVVKNI